VNIYYENNKERYREPFLLDVEEISTKDEKRINQLADEIRKGASFDSVFHMSAKMVDVKTARTGLIPYNPNDYMIVNAAKMNPGDNSEPYKNSLGGYSMIKLLEKKEGQRLPLKSVKERVVLDCLNFKKQIAYNEWVANLLSKYKVQIFPDRLKSVFDIKLK
jgi:hypothetical protein